MDKNEEIKWSSFEYQCHKWLIRQRERLKSEPIICPFCKSIVPLIENCESCKKTLLEKYYHRTKTGKALSIITYIFLACCFLLSGYYGAGLIFGKIFPDLGVNSPTIKVFVAIVFSGIILKSSWGMINAALGESKSDNIVELSRQDQLYNASLKFRKEGFLSQSARCLAEYISLNNIGEFYLHEYFISTYKKLLFSNIKPVEISVIFKNIFIYESWLQLRRESMAFEGVSHNLVLGMKGKIYNIISKIISDNDELILLAKEFQILRNVSEKSSRVLDKLIENAKTNAPIVANSLSNTL